jgi:uncharacterized protein
MHSYTFRIVPERLAIVRLPAQAPLPAWARGEFVTLSRTPTELSVICAQRHVPAELQQERDKIAFGIVGVVPMTTIGLLAALCGALAAAQVPVFAVSTYDTDYLLVSADKFPAAQRALEELGQRIEGLAPLT